MAQRGFFAELQHQAKLDERARAKAIRDQDRAHNAAIRRAEKAIREAERARKAEERANRMEEREDEAERKRLAKEAKEAHVAAMLAEVDRRNLELAETYEEIDSLLGATLDVDDYVDLNELRRPVEHPPFDRPELEQPVSLPEPVPDAPEPVFTKPEAPKGIKSVFGRKGHRRKVAEAESAHALRLIVWRERQKEVESAREEVTSDHETQEAQRLEQLKGERARYQAECTRREAEAGQRDHEIDQLIADLGYGTVDAVQEYVSIVLANSVYPPHFEVSHESSYFPETAELQLRVLIPGPEKLPTEKAFKYSKAADEITSTAQTQKARKERYASAVHQVALRSIHEIFEADRRALIKTVSLEVGTETISPATGKETYVLFVAAGAARESFLELDLSRIVPAATLQHLGASISKNPIDLIPADATGIRRS